MIKFSLGKMSMQMRSTMKKVEWRSVVRTNSPICPLFKQMNEDLDQMFFQCSFTAEGKGCTILVYKMAMASSLYYLWLKRNRRVFTHKKQLSSTIIMHIIQETHRR
ncbi:hypothetical protein H5410_056173 [Solanum commersonii]|uniref:Reverse transcriptase zinc-binding domain-containing protein n=1 Tax=Solanum commersonii TaxID=4109 RepID=A0A9J5WLC8_SOLCO|nr:hypothetical protein H5410_056173 [Solanum commersonii]